MPPLENDAKNTVFQGKDTATDAGSCGLACLAEKLFGAFAAGGVVETCHGDVEALDH